MCCRSSCWPYPPRKAFPTDGDRASRAVPRRGPTRRPPPTTPLQRRRRTFFCSGAWSLPGEERPAALFVSGNRESGFLLAGELPDQGAGVVARLLRLFLVEVNRRAGGAGGRRFGLGSLSQRKGRLVDQGRDGGAGRPLPPLGHHDDEVRAPLFDRDLRAAQKQIVLHAILRGEGARIEGHEPQIRAEFLLGEAGAEETLRAIASGAPGEQKEQGEDDSGSRGRKVAPESVHRPVPRRNYLSSSMIWASASGAGRTRSRGSLASGSSGRSRRARKSFLEGST